MALPILFGVSAFLISLLDYRLGLLLLGAEVVAALILMWRVNPPKGTPRHLQPDRVWEAEQDAAAQSTVYWQNQYRKKRGLPLH